MTIKILNLYAGIGGNRKLWKGDIEVTAVENDPEIAKEYMKNYPQDFVMIGDAHEYLLHNYMNFDFIWSSPPCPTHSDARRASVLGGKTEAKYPNMELYEEIIFLTHFAKCKWVVENVSSYYEPLIMPQKIGRHYFWANFVIDPIKINSARTHNSIVGTGTIYGFSIADTGISEKRTVLRNLVDPELGLHVFNMAYKTKQKETINEEK